MPNSVNLQQTIARTTGLCILGSIAAWIILLLAAANHARELNGTYQVTAGPLVLNRIMRTASDGEVSVSFSFENGLVVYFVLAGVAGIAIGWLKTRQR